MNGGEGSSRTAPDDRQLARQRMEAVWRARADRLSKSPVPEEAGQSGRPVIILGVGEERYAIDLPDVAEILPPVRVTPVPGAAAAIAGVINVHGEIRPVIDLRQLLCMETLGSGEAARVILLRREAREMGLRIDSVGQIVMIGDGETVTGEIDPEERPAAGIGVAIAPNGDAERSTRMLSKYITRSTGDMLMLLSTEALYTELDTGSKT